MSVNTLFAYQTGKPYDLPEGIQIMICRQMIIIRSLSKYFGKLLALMSKANRTIHGDGVPVYPHHVGEFFRLFEQNDASLSFFGYMKVLNRLKAEGVKSFDAHQLRTVYAVIEEIDKHFSLERKLFFGYFSREYSVIEEIDKMFPLNCLGTFLFPGAVKEGLMCLLFRHLFDTQSSANSESSMRQLLQGLSLGARYLSVDAEVATLLMLITFAIRPRYVSFGGSHDELTRFLGLGQVSTALIDELTEIKVCTQILHISQEKTRGQDISVFVQKYSFKDCPRTFRTLLLLSLLNRLDEDAKKLLAGKSLIPLEDDDLDYLIRGFYDFDWRIDYFRPIPMEFASQFVPAQLRHQPKSLSKLHSVSEALDLLNPEIGFLKRLPVFYWFTFFLSAEDRRAVLHVCSEGPITKLYIQMFVWLIVLGDSDDLEATRFVKESTLVVLSLQDLVEGIPRCIEMYFNSQVPKLLLEKTMTCLELALHSAIELFRQQDVRIRDADELLDTVCLRMVSALRINPPNFALLHASYPELVNDVLWLRGQVRDPTRLNSERFYQLMGLDNTEALRICTLTAMCCPAIQAKLSPNTPRTWLRHCPLHILVELNQCL